jgi:hypothetical protein
MHDSRLNLGPRRPNLETCRGNSTPKKLRAARMASRATCSTPNNCQLTESLLQAYAAHVWMQLPPSRIDLDHGGADDGVRAAKVDAEGVGLVGRVRGLEEGDVRSVARGWRVARHPIVPLRAEERLASARHDLGRVVAVEDGPRRLVAWRGGEAGAP